MRPDDRPVDLNEGLQTLKGDYKPEGRRVDLNEGL